MIARFASCERLLYEVAAKLKACMGSSGSPVSCNATVQATCRIFTAILAFRMIVHCAAQIMYKMVPHRLDKSKLSTLRANSICW